MRRLSLAGMLASCLAFASCGPGAADRTPLAPEEATLASQLGDVVWASPATLGEEIAGDWTCDGSCRPGGVSETAQPAGSLQTRSTYGPGGEADTGVIIWSGKVPAGVRVLAIPVIATPARAGCEVRVSVGLGRRYRLSEPAGDWKFWRLNIGAGGERRIRIVARDACSGVGGWVAVGAPRLVQ
jgi:hypothetical protein